MAIIFGPKLPVPNCPMRISLGTGAGNFGNGLYLVVDEEYGYHPHPDIILACAMPLSFIGL